MRGYCGENFYCVLLMHIAEKFEDDVGPILLALFYLCLRVPIKLEVVRGQTSSLSNARDRQWCD